MPSTRHRRIVRRAVMALAVVVLLPLGYVTGYGAICWFTGRQQIKVGSNAGLGVVNFLHDTLYAPLHLYKDSDLPGSSFPRRLGSWCYFHGADASMTWDDVAELDESGIKAYSFHP